MNIVFSNITMKIQKTSTEELLKKFQNQNSPQQGSKWMKDVIKELSRRGVKTCK